MSVLILNPHVSVLGGGERYTFALADVLADHHEVRIGAGSVPTRDDLERRGFPTQYTIEHVPPSAYTSASRGVDIVIQLRLSPPVHRILAKRSVVVVQFPMKGLVSPRRPSAWIRQSRAARSTDTYVTYSDYCAKWLKARWRVDSEVIHPPAELGFSEAEKPGGILSISRFEPSKRHDIMIEAYAQLSAATRRRLPLRLVGGLANSARDRSYLEDLRSLAAGLEVQFHTNADQAVVRDLLAQSRFLWHAKGFGRPQDRPDLAEHFGIVVVEAMSFGTIPMAVADGGHLEIIDGNSGRLWSSIPELVGETEALAADPAEQERLRQGSLLRASRFSFDVFAERVRDTLC